MLLTSRRALNIFGEECGGRREEVGIDCGSTEKGKNSSEFSGRARSASVPRTHELTQNQPDLSPLDNSLSFQR